MPHVLVTPSCSPHYGVQGFFNKLGNESKGGFGAGKAPFWERPTFVLWSGAQPDPEAAENALAADEDFQNWKKKYDRSRRTVTRTGKQLSTAEQMQQWWEAHANIRVFSCCITGVCM